MQNLHQIWRRAGYVVSLLVLTVFSFASTSSFADSSLARFETFWPALLAEIDLDKKRNYLIYVIVPPATPVAVGDAEQLRKSFLSAALKNADTATGHSVVAWQCEGQRGMISMSGGMDSEARKLVFAGWGGTAIMSSYRNGEIMGDYSLLRWHEDKLRKDQGHVIAAEVSKQACAAAREFVVRFLKAAHKPERHYGFLLNPGKLEGGTCVSFALELGLQAKQLSSIHPRLFRTVRLHQSAFGWLKSAPKVMVPFAVKTPPQKDIIVPKQRILFGPLNKGPVVAEARMMDPELVFAAFNGMRSIAGVSMQWHLKRMVSPKDPLVAKAFKAGRDWALGFKHVRVSKQDGLVAVVLEN